MIRLQLDGSTKKLGPGTNRPQGRGYHTRWPQKSGGGEGRRWGRWVMEGIEVAVKERNPGGAEQGIAVTGKGRSWGRAPQGNLRGGVRDDLRKESSQKRKSRNPALRIPAPNGTDCHCGGDLPCPQNPRRPQGILEGIPGLSFLKRPKRPPPDPRSAVFTGDLRLHGPLLRGPSGS